jgi:hypothetical protein
MGQYFKIVNEEKKEVVNAWDIGGGAKFWEWLANPQARVFVWLLRQSDEGGGGDIAEPERYQTLGRWAGDRITLIGDYDSSGLWDRSATTDADGKTLKDAAYTDISALVRKEFNAAIRRDGGHLDAL